MRSVECTPDFTISSGFWNLDGGKNCWQVGHFLENFVDKEQDMNIMMKDKIWNDEIQDIDRVIAAGDFNHSSAQNNESGQSHLTNAPLL